MTNMTVLTDVAAGIWLDEFVRTGADGPELPGSPDWSIAKRTLRGGLCDGVDLVELNNGALSLSLLPTRGMGIWRGDYRGIPLGWNSPVAQPVHPGFVDLQSRNGLGFLSGFNELICRCGLAFMGPPGLDVSDDGTETPITLHGTIANKPAHRVEASVSEEGPGRLVVSGHVDETSMFGPCLRLTSSVETEAGSNSFRLVDRVTNLAGRPSEFELLYHANLGPPFLEQGAQAVVPFSEMAPRDSDGAAGVETWSTFEAPRPGFAEQVFYFDPLADERGQTAVLMRNAAGDRGLSLRFNRRQLPWFVLWKNTQAEADGYVTGLEPAVNLPNFKSFERAQQRVVNLAPGETYETRIDFSVHDSAEAVAEVESRIKQLQHDVSPTVHRLPKPGWSPVEETTT